MTPTKILKQLHQNLLIVCLSAAADLVDFAEYSNNPEIINANKEQIKAIKEIYDLYKSGTFTKPIYDPSQTTILKKYAEQPKTIKKLFGEEPKIVTDSKGNTWYEFDIPNKFKGGKGEIKAFKDGGWLNKYK